MKINLPRLVAPVYFFFHYWGSPLVAVAEHFLPHAVALHRFCCHCEDARLYQCVARCSRCEPRSRDYRCRVALISSLLPYNLRILSLSLLVRWRRVIPRCPSNGYLFYTASFEWGAFAGTYDTCRHSSPIGCYTSFDIEFCELIRDCFLRAVALGSQSARLGAQFQGAKILMLHEENERMLATILITKNFVNVMIIILCNYVFADLMDFETAKWMKFGDFTPIHVEDS